MKNLKLVSPKNYFLFEFPKTFNMSLFIQNLLCKKKNSINESAHMTHKMLKGDFETFVQQFKKTMFGMLRY